MTHSAQKALHQIDGHLPIEDNGLVGNGATAALILRDGGVARLCVPRFDSPPLFCNLLDREQGGTFRFALDDLRESRKYFPASSGSCRRKSIPRQAHFRETTRRPSVSE